VQLGEQDDLEALLQLGELYVQLGVAMAGLVGVLRRLRNLTEWCCLNAFYLILFDFLAGCWIL